MRLRPAMMAIGSKVHRRLTHDGLALLDETVQPPSSSLGAIGVAVWTAVAVAVGMGCVVAVLDGCAVAVCVGTTVRVAVEVGDGVGGVDGVAVGSASSKAVPSSTNGERLPASSMLRAVT